MSVFKTISPVGPFSDADSCQTSYQNPGAGSIERTVCEWIGDQYVSVLDFNGVIGDGVNDDTAGIQAAMDYAKSVGKLVYLPRPALNYRITSALQFSDSGGGIVAEDKSVEIRQTTNAENGIDLLLDATDGNLLRRTTFKNFVLTGNGKTTSTGKGINAGPSILAHNGNFIHCEDLLVQHFGTGLYHRYFDDSRYIGCSWFSNGINVDVDLNTNCVEFILGVNSSAQTRGWQFGVGGKALIIGVDNGNQPTTCYNEGKVEFKNCNFENPTGGVAMIECANNSMNKLSGICTFLGAGSAIPPMSAVGTSQVMIDLATANGFAGGTPFITASNGTNLRISQGILGSNTLVTRDTGAYQHAPTQFQVQNDVSSRVPSVSNRFQAIIYARTDASSVDDRLMMVARNSLGTYTDEPLLNRDMFRITTATGATAMSPNTRYLANNAGTRVVLTLPASASTAVGMEIEVVGIGAAGWQIAQNASQRIQLAGVVTTTGVTGFLNSGSQYDVVRIKYTGSNFWEAIYIVGEPVTDTGAAIVRSVNGGGTGVATITGLVKGNGTAAFSAAVAGTDYPGLTTANTWTGAQRFDSGIVVQSGANEKIGQATLVAGTVTVANTSVTANSRIFLSVSTVGGTQGILSYTVVAATSFTINSTDAADTSTVDWFIIESV